MPETSQMLTNILEQPSVAQKCLALELDLPKIPIQGILIAACGSSRHAGLVARFWFEQLAQIPTQVLDAADWENPMTSGRSKTIVPPNSLLYLLSQSGKTSDVLQVIDQVGSQSLPIWSITNGIDTPLSRASSHILQTPAGEEKAVAATKTLLAQMILLLRVAMELGQSTQPNLQSLPTSIQQTIDLSQSIAQTIAAKIAQAANIVLLGRGIDYPIALEGALKLKETTYIHAEGLSAGDFMHGPIAIVEPGFPVILIAIPGSPSYEAAITNAKRVKSYGAYLIGITTVNNPDQDVFDVVLPIAEIEPLLSPLLTVISLQLLAFYIAQIKGLDIDRPRNLTKFIG
jgi:glucosamine 6-phosphate synthetase-like amidotransferase/phosphosugar isomerase protein